MGTQKLRKRRQDERIVKEFNDWIAGVEVEDVPCVGRKFTWYRPNGTARSRLYRIFVSAEWFNKSRKYSIYIGVEFLKSLPNPA